MQWPTHIVCTYDQRLAHYVYATLTVISWTINFSSKHNISLYSSFFSFRIALALLEFVSFALISMLSEIYPHTCISNKPLLLIKSLPTGENLQFSKKFILRLHVNRKQTLFK